MNRRIEGKRIQPADVTPDVYTGASIVDDVVLASSNHLRTYLELQEQELLSGAVYHQISGTSMASLRIWSSNQPTCR